MAVRGSDVKGGRTYELPWPVVSGAVEAAIYPVCFGHALPGCTPGGAAMTWRAP